MTSRQSHDCQGSQVTRGGLGPPIEVRRGDIGSPVAADLIQALNVELSGRYPEPGANHFRLEASEVAEGQGAFLLAYAGGAAIGCGAVRRRDGDTAEIKRMYVVPHTRGRGVGHAVLMALEEESRRLGIGRIVLETGERQPEALALYARAGFERIPPFGEYIGSPLSVCMAKKISP
jgi:putative acetyltransferase